MKYKAIFFDRDGTLTYFDKEKELWRDQIISQWSGKPFELPYDKMMKLFNLASQGKKPWYKTVDDERGFFKRFYRQLLIDEGVKKDIDGRAKLLFNELWCNGDRALFPETVEVLFFTCFHMPFMLQHNALFHQKKSILSVRMVADGLQWERNIRKTLILKTIVSENIVMAEKEDHMMNII